MTETVKIKEISTDPDIQCREHLDDDTIKSYAEEIMAGDALPPVVLFRGNGKFYIGDGWHRVYGSIRAKKTTIDAETHEGGREKAFEHACGANRVHGLRRTNADKRKAVTMALDWWPKATQTEIAVRCGVSQHFVSTLRSKLHKPDPVKEYFLLAEDDQLTDDLIAERIAKSTKTFNQQKGPGIEWAQWSWNPITGCKHNCPYCYARDIAVHRLEQRFEPSFYPDRFAAPSNTNVPTYADQDIRFKNVFTCSMADLFGKWVPLSWIKRVMDTVEANPQWNFLFLTKFPNRFAELGELPRNAWMGTTVDCQSRVKNAEKSFAKLKHGTKWLSVEPMLEPLVFDDLSAFDWVVIGGATRSTQTPEWIPPYDWIAQLSLDAHKAGAAVYHKENLGGFDALKEFPWIERPWLNCRKN